MDFNLFQWIRDGVKQSVLQGVSDAIRQIGTPDDSAPLHESLQRSLGQQAVPAVAAVARPATTGRRRLGKSLKEIGPAPKN
ncbi:MAG TPA: hypothetical protein DCQ98_19065 [Planctomycetaceae bacterium]|nr:hypothetical protein [Planctomycetaceae bacterium]HRF01721.1 hypothetical protein [Pirellulaceae bacterium]